MLASRFTRLVFLLSTYWRSLLTVACFVAGVFALLGIVDFVTAAVKSTAVLLIGVATWVLGFDGGMDTVPHPDLAFKDLEHSDSRSRVGGIDDSPIHLYQDPNGMWGGFIPPTDD